MLLLRSLALLTLTFGAVAHAAPPSEKEAGPKVGSKAPNFTLKTINPKRSGLKSFSLRKYVGTNAKEPKEAVVLTFSASYCEPCKKELDEIRALKEKLAKKNILLAVVVIDTEKEGIEEMRALTVDKLKIAYPVLSDRFGVLARRYKANTLPMTIIIDKAFKIHWVNSGYAADALEKLEVELGISGN